LYYSNHYFEYGAYCFDYRDGGGDDSAPGTESNKICVDYNDASLSLKLLNARGMQEFFERAVKKLWFSFPTILLS
jgi:hypothetical protein